MATRWIMLAIILFGAGTCSCPSAPARTLTALLCSWGSHSTTCHSYGSTPSACARLYLSIPRWLVSRPGCPLLAIWWSWSSSTQHPLPPPHPVHSWTTRCPCAAVVVWVAGTCPICSWTCHAPWYTSRISSLATSCSSHSHCWTSRWGWMSWWA